MAHHVPVLSEAFDDAIKAMFLEGASHIARKPVELVNDDIR